MNTMQQEFDAIAAHLYSQQRPARDGVQCLYRADGGLMCAVGCRIPDSVYDEEMEGSSASNMICQFDHVLPAEFVEYEDMYEALQTVHDGWVQDRSEPKGYSIDYLNVELAKVARDFNLTFTVPQ